MNDIFGQALFDHHKQAGKHKLWINNKYGPKEEMPVDVYFRNDDEMPDLELLALSECRGSVLDIGAGAGSHSLVLQGKGIDVTALDISPLAVAIMQQRGVKKALIKDVFEFSRQQYDTLLLLMNGIGLCGTLDGLRKFLRHAKTLVRPGGCLLFDSSDVAYLYDGQPPLNGDYYGEISYQYVYKGKKTNWFKWLYVDKETLTKIALEEEWICEVLYYDDMDQYLSKLNPVGNQG